MNRFAFQCSELAVDRLVEHCSAVHLQCNVSIVDVLKTLVGHLDSQISRLTLLHTFGSGNLYASILLIRIEDIDVIQQQISVGSHSLRS